MTSAIRPLSFRIVVPLCIVLVGLTATGDGFAGPPFANPVIPIDIGEPHGLFAGDLNGDGRDDLAATLDGSDEVLVIHGPLSNPPQAGDRYPVGHYPIGVAAGDLDGDGLVDLVVMNSLPFELSILLGRQDGTFAAERRLALPEEVSGHFIDAEITRGLAIADWDGDGAPDLAVVNGLDISLLRGLGDGDFVPAGRVTAGDCPVALVAADFDADGRIDLAATSICSADLAILKGRGDGSFDSPARYPAGITPWGLATADLDGDGDLDIVTTGVQHDPFGNRAGDVGIFIGSGDGRFSPGLRYPTGLWTQRVVLGDFDKDGRIDIAAGNLQAGDVSVLFGSGDGTFGGQISIRTGGPGIDLVTADLDADGRLDLLSSTLHGGITFVRGIESRGFGPQETLGMNTSPRGVAVADFDGDGRQDVIVVGDEAFFEAANATLFPGLGDGRFGEARDLHLGEPGMIFLDVAAADLNGDGRTDLAIVDGISSVGVILGGGNLTFGPVSWIETGREPAAVIAADFNGDGRRDLAVAHYSSDGVLILLGRGDGTFEPGQRLIAGLSHSDVVAADFDGDGALDLAVVGLVLDDALNYEYVLLTWKGLGDGRFEGPEQHALAYGSFAAAAGDLDGNGLPDLLVTAQGEIDVFVNAGSGRFGSGVPYPAQWTMGAILAADFTGDGKVDAAVLDNRTEVVGILPGLGDGTFGSEMRFEAGSSPNAFASADFDRNGAPDLVVADLGPPGISPTRQSDLWVMLNQAAPANRPPVAVAIAPEQSECTGPSGASVLLDGTGSHDPDPGQGGLPDLATFDWYEDYGRHSQVHLGSAPRIEVTLPLGRHEITLHVTDRSGAFDDAVVVTTVADTLPPRLLLRSSSPSLLWPPDHRLIDLNVTAIAEDQCGPVQIALQSVISSEPDDAPGDGDGHTTGDVRGADIGSADFDFQVRAERSASGPGRTYTASYRARDGSGHSVETSLRFIVPTGSPSRAHGGPAGARGPKAARKSKAAGPACR